MKRILVTSLGTVNAGAVVASLRKMGGVEILGADINEARCIANSRDVDAFYRFPSVVDAKETYVDFLKAFCVENDVDGVSPFIDEEVLMLSEQKDEFAKLGVVIFVPDFAVVSLCHDKVRFGRWMAEHFPAFAIPAFGTRDAVEYPAFVKPREGRASLGCRRVDSRRELDAAIPEGQWNDFVVQPLMSGRIVAADIVRDRASGAVSVIQREELLRNGNGCGIAVEMVDDEKVETFCRAFAETVDLNGVVNAEFFLTDDGPKVIEVNPRLPAGTAYDCLAGFDVVRCAFDIGYGGGYLPTRPSGSAAASPAATRPSRRKRRLSISDATSASLPCFHAPFPREGRAPLSSLKRAVRFLSQDFVRIQCA